MTGATTNAATILASRFTPSAVRATLLPFGSWVPFPAAADRAAWEHLPDGERARLIAAATARLGLAWPELPATLFLDFARDGDRRRYEERHFARRYALADLVLGECAEGAGRFLDDIVNGVWALCEESFWGVSAHSYSPRFTAAVTDGRYPSVGLPDTAHPVIDLFAAETGALLGWTYYLLGPQLDVISPVITDRIEREVRARLLDPFRLSDEWWWLGAYPDRKVNNWTPWILSNLLPLILLFEREPERRAALVSRAIAGLDRFLATYHADGGCDEGTSYWGRAGASLFECLETLLTASGGALIAFDLPLIRAIGRFIERMHIGGDWYVNFADGAARITPDAHLIYRYGRRTGDLHLAAHGAVALREGTPPAPSGSLARLLHPLFDLGWMSIASAPPPVRDVWLDGVQVLVAREAAGTAGLFLAAKGGHNGESHNHNDVGSFIVGLDGRPAVIDVGVGVYTRQTFGPERYSIWTMRSDYHNLPLIDGCTQQEGERFAARAVRAEMADDHAQLTLDLAGAYPESAGIRTWERTLRLERGARPRIVLSERWELTAAPATLALHLMLANPTETGPGWLRCATPTGALLIAYDPAQFSARIEPIVIDDDRLGPVWGEQVYRAILDVIAPTAQGAWQVTFAAE
jgi:hypothetical protein